MVNRNDKKNPILCTCAFCNTELDWEATDQIHGDMWSCSICGKDFCEKCFTDRLGRKGFRAMMQDDRTVQCPDCFAARLPNFNAKPTQSVTIQLDLGPFIRGAKLTLDIPTNVNKEEYMDEYLDSILNEDLRYNADWEFA